MATRRSVLFVLVGVLASMGASSYRTPNFVVQASTPEIAKQVGQWAEYYRKEKAVLWLGREMQQWPQPCPVKVTVTMDGAGGATSFVFDDGAVLGQDMHIEGSLDRLLASVLPHEVTHTVFAYHFRCPLPRWADEGGAVLSEDDKERNQHDMMVRQKLNAGHAIPLRRLFALRQYPRDVMALYAEGFSVADFLVRNSNRQTFLTFVGQGMREGWDRAVQTHYRYKNVEELEQAWLSHLKATRRPPVQVAQNTRPAQADPARRLVVRDTALPVPPGDWSKPVYRSQAPASEQEADWPARQQPSGAAPALGYLPDPASNQPPAGTATPMTKDSWQAAVPFEAPSPGPRVRLGPPQLESPPPPSSGWIIDNPYSPAGYPR